jgi:GNAT superfamily N-acetyltransferase
MEILKAERADLARILELQKACYAREAERTGDPDIPPMRQTLTELEAEYDRSVVLKGVEDAAIIGSVRAYEEAGSCYVGRLVVAGERRGEGRGSALLRAAEAAFPRAERYELFTASASPDTIRLYERAGYRQFKAVPAGAAYCLVYLEKPGPASKEPLSLGIDAAGLGDYAAYRDFWRRLPRIEARMVEKHEDCRHELGETIMFDSPYERPAGICHALCHVFQLHLWRLSLGFPSWNAADRSVYRLHCPDAKGTVWELRALPREGGAPGGS